MLTAVAVKRILSGNTSIVKKVYEAVPSLKEASSRDIRSEMLRLNGTSPTLEVICGCLKNLVDVGLVKSDRLFQTFIRVPVKAAKTQSEDPGTEDDPINDTEDLKEASPMSKTWPIPAGPLEKTTPSQIGDIAATLRKLADQLDAVALQVQQDKEDSTEAVKALDTLRALFGKK